VPDPLTICGEIRLRIRQNLLSTATGIGEIAKVYSHAQSLAQCAQWLAQHLPGAARVAVASNAEAARLAAGEPGSAAIAGENAAAIYGLNVVAPHIEDEPNNTTRFWVLGRQPVPHRARRRPRDVGAQSPGAVHSLLRPFATHGVSMSRFESRPRAPDCGSTCSSSTSLATKPTPRWRRRLPSFGKKPLCSNC
jgi:chorismate mutase/prephenate dehydratase